MAHLFAGNQTVLEWRATQASLLPPLNVMHRPLPIVADILRSVLSTVKWAHEDILQRCRSSVLVDVSCMNPPTAVAPLTIICSCIVLTTYQMDSSHAPIQRHRTCQGRKPRSMRFTRILDRKLFVARPFGHSSQVAVDLRFQCGLWTNVSSDVTEKSNMLACHLSALHCAPPTPRVLWTVCEGSGESTV